MRKLGIMTAIVALGLLCGCTKVEEQLGLQMSEYRVSISTDKSVLVDVSTSEAGQTRGTQYEKMPDANLEGIGIYCLPKRAISAKATTVTPNWSRTVDATNYAGTFNYAYWTNVKCQAESKVDKDGFYDLQVVGNNPSYEYYPLTSDFGFEFYGYAPYKETSEISASSNWIRVPFDLDGTVDVIHGVSKTPSELEYWGSKDATTQSELTMCYYSARYFRKAKETSEVEMVFKHKLTRLNFNVIPCADSEGSYESVEKLAVKSITLQNVIGKGELYIAAPETHQGEFKGIPENDPIRTNFSLRKADWSETAVDECLQEIVISNPDANVEGKADTLSVGAYMMVVPERKYSMCLELWQKDGSVKYEPIELTLQLAESFAAGKMYNINISIEGPTKIKLISAELVDWEYGGSVDLDYDSEG